MPTEPPISVAEACEMQPGDEQTPSWINAGVTGTVASITPRETKKGGKMWVCVLRDNTIDATIEFSMFTAPKFTPGDLIDVTGKGLRRTDYNGKPQLSLGKSVEVHKLGRGVDLLGKGGSTQTAKQTSGQVSAEDATEPANEPLHPIAGQTVVMAMKEAIALVDPNHFTGTIGSPDYWRAVHAAASDVIRVSRMLERGQLAPSARTRAKANAESDKPAPPPTAPRKPTPPAAHHITETQEEDVPF